MVQEFRHLNACSSHLRSTCEACCLDAASVTEALTRMAPHKLHVAALLGQVGGAAEQTHTTFLLRLHAWRSVSPAHAISPCPTPTHAHADNLVRCIHLILMPPGAAAEEGAGRSGSSTSVLKLGRSRRCASCCVRSLEIDGLSERPSSNRRQSARCMSKQCNIIQPKQRLVQRMEKC